MTVELLTELFEYEGYVVSKAYNGFEALAKIEAEKPDIISLSVRMPPGNRRLRDLPAHQGRSGDGAYIPVVMVAGQCDDASRARGFEAGADDYIIKPFRIIELTARVRSLLRQQR